MFVLLEKLLLSLSLLPLTSEAMVLVAIVIMDVILVYGELVIRHICPRRCEQTWVSFLSETNIEVVASSWRLPLVLSRHHPLTLIRRVVVFNLCVTLSQESLTRINVLLISK